LTPRLAVLASGSGSNFQAILDASRDGRLEAAIVVLVASKPGIGAITRAEEAGIPVEIPDSTESLAEVLIRYEPDRIVLAGWLRLIPGGLVEAYSGRILNIHPALLPKYGGAGMYGRHVHRAVINAGEPVSGCTVHEVTAAYDEGPILGQVAVPVHADDTPETLAARVLVQEHRLYPSIIQTHLHGR
jgi:phosphoribosylglycinamide formyltransferase 1